MGSTVVAGLTCRLAFSTIPPRAGRTHTQRLTNQISKADHDRRLAVFHIRYYIQVAALALAHRQATASNCRGSITDGACSQMIKIVAGNSSSSRSASVGLIWPWPVWFLAHGSRLLCSRDQGPELVLPTPLGAEYLLT
jgi:hypothetical protein